MAQKLTVYGSKHQTAMDQRLFSFLIIFSVCFHIYQCIPDSILLFMDNIPQFTTEQKQEQVSSSCEDLSTLLESETKLFNLVAKVCEKLGRIEQAKKLMKTLRKIHLTKPKKLKTWIEKGSSFTYPILLIATNFCIEQPKCGQEISKESNNFPRNTQKV